MNRTGTALAVTLMVLMCTACGPGSGRGTSSPRSSPPADHAVLASFVDSEKKLDDRQLTAALQAGADLAKAGDGIRTAWDAGRKRILSSLGPKGVVQPASATDRSPARFTPAVFDFASMAWATWSLGLLYLGNDASGTTTHGPTASGDVTSTESMTVAAAKQGPVASVKMSTTHSQTSKQGWSVTQTGTVELTMPLCPDKEGVIAFDIHLELTTTGTSGGWGTSTVTDTLTGHTVASVNDEAHLASVQITGSYDHNVVARGPGLTVAAGESGIHVDVADAGVTAKSTGSVPDAQIQEARGYGATLLRLAGMLAAARAGDFYEAGYCTEIVASPNRKPTEVAVGATQPFDVRVRHKWDGGELTDRITARLEGTASVSPNGQRVLRHHARPGHPKGPGARRRAQRDHPGRHRRRHTDRHGGTGPRRRQLRHQDGARRRHHRAHRERDLAARPGPPDRTQAAAASGDPGHREGLRPVKDREGLRYPHRALGRSRPVDPRAVHPGGPAWFLGMLTTVVFVAGCGAASGPARGDGTNPGATPGTDAPSPTTAPIVAIPDDTLLQPADLGGGAVIPSGFMTPLLSPCWPAVTVSETKIDARKDEVVTYRYTDNREDITNLPIPDGDAGEAILVFQADNATAYLTELRAQLGRCATVDREDVTWRHAIVGNGFAGDDSLVWQRTTTQTEPTGVYYTDTELVATVRIGRVVLVLAAMGEKIHLTTSTRTRPTDRRLFDRLVAAAVNRVATLRQ